MCLRKIVFIIGAVSCKEWQSERILTVGITYLLFAVIALFFFLLLFTVLAAFRCARMISTDNDKKWHDKHKSIGSIIQSAWRSHAKNMHLILHLVYKTSIVTIVLLFNKVLGLE